MSDKFTEEYEIDGPVVMAACHAATSCIPEPDEEGVTYCLTILAVAARMEAVASMILSQALPPGELLKLKSTVNSMYSIPIYTQNMEVDYEVP